MTWPPVLSQRTYPGAGDVDDCWVVATVWAAGASVPGLRKPTVTEFRRFAGDPDDGVRDGGSLTEVIAGSRGCWPTLSVVPWDTPSWDSFAAAIKAGRPASVALDSAILPAVHRYNFYGKHQCGLAWDARLRAFVLANPLAAEGSAPKVISEAAIKAAVLALLPSRVVRAAVYPPPLPDTATEDIVKVYTVPGPQSSGSWPASTPIYPGPTGPSTGVTSAVRRYLLVGQDHPTAPTRYHVNGAWGALESSGMAWLPVKGMTAKQDETWEGGKAATIAAARGATR